MFKAPERIPVAGPSITDLEVKYAAEAARTAWFGNHYAYNSQFEKALGNYVGAAHAVTVPHCTAALHLALAAGKIGPGDEVIVPDVTWIASAAPIIYVGARPVFVDIKQDTWCIDPRAVEAAIGPKTRAIIGVDLYGSMCEWDQLQAIADRHSLLLVEDAAEALGSAYKGDRAGSFGHAATFSFHGSKTVATGEGGMLVTNQKDLYDRVLVLRDHGRAPGDRFFQNHEVGFKYRMSGVTAALGCAQMERIDELIAHKRQIFAWYHERLRDRAGLQLNCEPENTFNSYWMVTVIPDADYGYDKFALMKEMELRNVDTRPFFSQLSRLSAFDDYPESKRFCTSDAAGIGAAIRGINLPSGYNMNEALVDAACQALVDVLWG